MNLSGIFNLPEPARSQGAGQAQTSSNAAAVPSNSGAVAPNGGKTDQASLSSSGMAAAHAAAQPTAAAGAASDVRMEKVASVSAAIQAGTYSVSPVQVANKIMQGMLDPSLQ